MKKISKILAVGFIMTVAFSFVGFSANCTDLQGKVVRLHVRANSDSEYDQRIKLAVKDSVFGCAEEIVVNADSAYSAAKLLEDNIKLIENAANLKLKELGADYKAQVMLKKEFFYTREYDTFTLPAGNYTSLIVNLGEGQGKNWWCAVYPGLCVPSATDYGDLTADEKKIVTEKDEYRVSFKIYEWYQSLVNLFSGQ